MPNIMASAAAQHPARSAGAALNHLAPVVDLLSRSLANPKSQQGPGAWRWPMVVTLLERAYAGAKSLLAIVGLTALAGALLLPLSGDGMSPLAVFGQDGLFEPATTVAGSIQAP